MNGCFALKLIYFQRKPPTQMFEYYIMNTLVGFDIIHKERLKCKMYGLKYNN